MAINVISTTDTKEAVTAAIGGLATEALKKVEAPASEPEKKEASSDETPEVSEPSEEADGSEQLEAEAGEDEEKPEDEEKLDDEKPKKKNGFKKRIDKLTRRLSEREQELEYWKKQATTAKPDQDKPVSEPIKEAAQSSDKPKADQFETHEEYVEALTDWKIEQREAKQRAIENEKKLKSETQTRLESFQSKVKEFAKSVDDFQETLEEVDDIKVSIGLHEALLTSEHGPQVMYELAKNREEYERVNKLPPIAAAREIGKIEARIAKSSEEEQEEKPRKQTNAPAPIKPVGSKATKVAKSIHDPNLSQKEYERLRDEQEAKRRR